MKTRTSRTLSPNDRHHIENQAESTFDAWMRRVDASVETRTGISVYDLPDCCYRDWYDDGVTPASATSRAIRSAKSEGGF